MVVPLIKSDLPTHEDQLGFAAYRDALVNIITTSQTPLAIGLFGAWGSGKTSLMRMIQEVLDKKQQTYVTVWFNAWKYDRQEALWRALILHLTKIIRSIEEKKQEPINLKALDDLDRFEQSLYRTVEWEEFTRWSIDWAKAISNTTELAADIALSLIPGAKPIKELLAAVKKGISDEEKTSILDAFRREVIQRYREQVLSREQFESQFLEIITKYLVPQQRLVVFIDDLDRCLPENIIQTLEAVKLFLDVQGCVFVLGFDQKMVEQAVVQRLDGDKERSRQYLEKIIQLPFFLPPIEQHNMEVFLKKLTLNLPDPCCEVFSKGLRGTPREAKRIVNIFSLLWQLSQEQQNLRDCITPGRLAKFVIIQHNFRDLYELLRKTPRHLRDLELFVLADKEPAVSKTPDNQAPVALPEDLEPFVNQAALREILACAPQENFYELTLEEVSTYIYLVFRAQGTQMEYFPYAPEMVRINAAEYSMGIDLSEARQIEEQYSIVTGGLLSETPKVKAVLKPYSIGRYPVTNREYFAFVEETGCRPPVHWIAGSYPSNQGDHPVVNVSWEDANQYCAWLSQKTNKTYRLPSEAEWEYAARGNTDFRFPWGNEWDQQRCNTKESNYQHATPVDLFSQIGSSWCGCADMAGNVSEWTKSSFVPYPGNTNTQTKNNLDDRVLRGGSWNHAAEKARCTYRSCETLTLRESWIGFRCACDL